MSDQLPAATTPAARAPRVYTPVESAYGIMDTARFEHLGRVATVLAKAGLLPQSITHVKEGSEMVWLDFETIQARAFLLANQADIWGADPLAVSQACGIVHGKLVYEGKLVNAVIEARLGIRLNFEFGTYDPATRETSGAIPTDPENRNLGVRVWGQFPDEDTPRDIHGSVAMWHTGDKGPWKPPAEWPRQLRYMGARSWARAHSPGIVVGILTDTEVEERWERVEAQASRRVKVDTAAKLAAKGDAPKDGFSIAHVIKETEAEPELEKAEEVVDDAADPTPSAEPVEQDTATNTDGSKTDAPASNQDTDSSGPSATNAASPSNSPEAASHPAEGLADNPDPAEWTVLENHEGPAPTGIQYLLAGDEIMAGRVPTYQDGERFSTVTQKGAAQLPQYTEHPTPEQMEPAEGPSDVEADDVPETIEETVTEAESGQGGGFLAEMRAADSWLVIKRQTGELSQTPEWKAASEEDRDDMRRAIAAITFQLKARKPEEPVEPTNDPTFFRLWLATKDSTAADTIEANLRALKKSPGWTKLSEANQEALVALAAQQARKGAA